MKRYLLICLFLVITSGCRHDQDPEGGTTIDYIRRTGRLWGVAEVTLNENGSITLIDAKSSGVGLNLIMHDANNRVVDSVTLSPGQSCSLSDGRHVFITYEFKAVEQGRVSITVTDKFDARSFGDSIKQTKATINISPYKNQDLPKQMDSHDISRN
jgi:hypothetical protein